MKNNFISIVQKCICMDFLLNSLIDLRIYEYCNFLSIIKENNIRNIKILCQLYKKIYNDELSIESVDTLHLNRNNNDLNALLQINLNIITELKYLKRFYISDIYFDIIQNLTNNYFGFISLINCCCPSTLNYNSTRIPNNNSHFFYMIDSSYNDFDSNELPYDTLRLISLESINYFFDYSFDDNQNYNESYEIFFSNSPENKFYQFFFKSKDNSFKVRISSKSGLVFYIYKSINSLNNVISTPLSKEDAINFTDIYLKEKFKELSCNLLYDNSYIDISYYMNNIESYKFRYNYINFDIKKSLYITINAEFNIIQEISLF